MLTWAVAWAAKQTKSPEMCAFFLLSIPADFVFLVAGLAVVSMVL